MSRSRTIGILLALSVALVALLGGAVAVSAQGDPAPPAAPEGGPGGAWLGLMVVPIDDTTRDRFDITAESGLYVVRVVPEGPAAAVGVEEGAVILEADGVVVTTVRELHALVQDKQPGDTVELLVDQGASVSSIEVTLADPPERTGIRGKLRHKAGVHNPFGEGGAEHTVTAEYGTVESASESSLTITKRGTGEPVTYVVTADTKVHAGPEATAADLEPGTEVVVVTHDGSDEAERIMAAEAIREHLESQRPAIEERMKQFRERFGGRGQP